MNKLILSAATRGGGNILLSHTIKANYYKMGVITTGNDGFDAMAVMIEYD